MTIQEVEKLAGMTRANIRFYEKEGDTEYLDDAQTLCERLKIKHIY